jgi:hypothetical protein
MIVVFPMLTSRSVSQNVIPGIAKALEKFTIVYGMDKILRVANSSLHTAVGNVVSLGTGGILKMQEATEIIDEDSGGRYKTGKQSKRGQTVQLGTSPQSSDDDDEQQGQKRGPKPIQIKTPEQKINIHDPSYAALSIEPTWISIQTGRAGLKVLGVKVLPFFVDAPDGIISAMLRDTALDYNEYLTQKFKRASIRLLWKLARTFHVGGDRVITGDPDVDILWATTQYKHNIFTCFNQIELEAPGILDSPATVKKLFNLGWTSFIVADDVNKKATYCMEEFGGVCSTVPYNFLYSSLGSEHSKVFQTIDDVRKSAGPFFRMTTSKRKIFGECLAKNKQTEYLAQSLQEWSLVDKVKDLKKSFFLDLFKRLGSAIPSNDGTTIRNALSKVPEIPFNVVESTCAKLSPAFERNYELAKRMLRKSTDIVDKEINYLSCLLAFGSTMDTENPDKEVKENLNSFITSYKSRTTKDDIQSSIRNVFDVLGMVIKLKNAVANTILGILAAIATFIASMPMSLTIGLCIIIAILIIFYISRDK